MAKILIVEDEPRLAQLLADYQRHSHFEPEQTGSAADDEQRVRDGDFDAVLLDLMLPDGDGMASSGTPGALSFRVRRQSSPSLPRVRCTSPPSSVYLGCSAAGCPAAGAGAPGRR